MEFERKQAVLQQRFWFRAIVCIVSLAGSVLYLIFNDNTSFWGLTIGICGSALVWSLVELFDFFVQTYYQYESERNTFWGVVMEHFSRMKTIIRASSDEIPMQELKAVVNELYNEINPFIFNSNIYPVSKEFDMCSNYIERMYWKFYACCSDIYNDFEEQSEYYKKLHDSILLIKEEKEDASTKRSFNVIFIKKIVAEMTDIELSFERYQIPEDIVSKDVTGNIKETFTIPDNMYVTTTFIPDLAFYNLYQNSKTKAFCTVMCLLFRKVKIT